MRVIKFYIVRAEGIEPSTSVLPACQSRAEILVGVGGIEPPTSVLSGQRSTTELHTQNFGLSGGQVRIAFYH